MCTHYTSQESRGKRQDNITYNGVDLSLMGMERYDMIWYDRYDVMWYDDVGW